MDPSYSISLDIKKGVPKRSSLGLSYSICLLMTCLCLLKNAKSVTLLMIILLGNLKHNLEIMLLWFKINSM